MATGNDPLYEVSEYYDSFDEAARAAAHYVITGVILKKPPTSTTATDQQIGNMKKYQSRNSHQQEKYVGLYILKEPVTTDPPIRWDFLRLDFERTPREGQKWKGLHFNAQAISAQGDRVDYTKKKFSACLTTDGKTVDQWEEEYEAYLVPLQRTDIVPNMIWTAWSGGHVVG